MLKENYIRYLDNQLSLFKKNFSNLKKNKDPEIIRFSRTNIKKLKAILFAFNFRNHKKIKSLFKNNFQVLFKAMGKLREYQVMTTIVESYEIKMHEQYNFLKRFLIKKTNKRTKKLNKKLMLQDEYFIDEFTLQLHKHLKELPNEILERKSKEYIKYEFDTIRKLFADNKVSILHEQRKNLKKIRYWLEIYQSTYKDPKMKKLIEEIKKSESCLGNWNDKEDLHSCIKNNYVELTENEMNYEKKLEVLINHIIEDKNKLILSYNKSVKEFIDFDFELK